MQYLIRLKDPFARCRKLLCLMPQAINFNFVGFFKNYFNQGDIFLHSEKMNLIPFSWNKEGQVTLSNYVTWEFAFAFYTKHSFTWNITVSLKTAEKLCSTTNRNFIFPIKAPAAILHAESVNGMERRSCWQYRWKNF